MSRDLAEQKRALRRVMRDAREALGAPERKASATKASFRLLALPALADLTGRVVAGYVAAGGENDPAEALAYVEKSGGTVALPRVSDTPPRLRFHTVGLGAPLRTGRFGLSEPPEDAPEVGAGTLAVVIVPGLAFDPAGGRVGFGGGYYDGVIDDARAGGAAVIGFAYDFQIVDRCPAGPDDRAVDVVVTETRVIRARG
jgi:5-formyltetrahydrofolate cyclo-ligase